MRFTELLTSILLLVLSMGVGAELKTFDCLIEPQMTIKLGSPVQGIVEEIPVRRGDTVVKGQVVARLQSALEQTSLEIAQTRYKYLESQFNRLTVVKSKSLTSDEIVDQAKSQMDSARLEVKRRELLLAQRSITSPVNAVVVERLLSPGEYVYEQTPILNLAKTDELNVEVLLPTAIYGRIEEGMGAVVIPEAPLDDRYQVTVSVIDKIMDAASSSFGVRLILPNPDLEIPAGLRCTLEFDL